ncbi:hypothetical protein C8F04DRAFT_1273041 [Mycena alexandri]|uniref:F-box domain-containing protein n=1 Tax=Mycena alexandri TaxID=1745969 RepID=A0AAD6S930_9AGAR|nr:hypothetical protein C8F04DRAFT_1273041 [Mycena alexandri]
MQRDGLRNELADLEVSILRQQILLEKMEKRRTAVQAELDAFIFPILSLPLEITGDIFLHYRREVYNWPKDLLLILTVCQAWRTVALSIPTLWTALDILLRVDKSYPFSPEEVKGYLIHHQSAITRSGDPHDVMQPPECNQAFVFCRAQEVGP